MGEIARNVLFFLLLRRGLGKEAHILISIFLFIIASSIESQVLFQKILFQNVHVDRFKREKLKNSHNIWESSFLCAANVV